MRVRFPRLADHQRGYAVVERDDGVVYRMDGFTVMGPDLPHHVMDPIVEPAPRAPSRPRGRAPPPPHSADRSERLKKAQRDKIRRAELLANLVEAIAALDDPSPGEINQVARVKLSAVPDVEPGAEPADVIALPPPAALAAAARALQVEAARWARLRVGDELVYEWPARHPWAVRTARPGA